MELRGSSEAGWAVWGAADSGTGLVGTAGSGNGVWGESISGVGATGKSTQSDGVQGRTNGSSSGVYGFNAGSGAGVRGESTSGNGVFGISTGGGNSGVLGTNSSIIGNGVQGRNTGGGIGVYGSSFGATGGIGVYGEGTHLAARFIGNTNVKGNLDVEGTISSWSVASRIDHPLEPDSKYLQHSFVQSPDMKLVYDGIQELDENGTAWVELPEWFEKLNQHYRYQLTPVGGPAPDLHVAEETYGNRFKIAGGKAGVKISWQVTGIRNDAWAQSNRVQVEIDKLAEEAVTGPMGEAQRQPPPTELSSLQYPMPPEPHAMPPVFHFARLEEEHRQQIDDLRRQIEQLRRRG